MYGTDHTYDFDTFTYKSLAIATYVAIIQSKNECCIR